MVLVLRSGNIQKIFYAIKFLNQKHPGSKGLMPPYRKAARVVHSFAGRPQDVLVLENGAGSLQGAASPEGCDLLLRFCVSLK